jgi:hypothetical protein
MTKEVDTKEAAESVATESIKGNTVKLPLGEITFLVDGFRYQYKPQPDLTIKELNDMMLMFVSAATNPVNWDIEGWIKKNNLLRHFTKA